MQFCRIGTGVLVCLFASVSNHAQLHAAEKARLLPVVRRTCDALIEHGRDHWGPEKTDLIASMLDRQTLEPYKKLPRGAAGVRNSDRTTLYGSNVNMQQNLFRTFYLLSQVTHDPKYAEAADAALLDFVRKTQSPTTGLLAWGEHLCWDLRTDKAGSLIADNLIHEPKKPLVFWDYLYRHEPQRMVQYARGIWEHQIADHKTGNFSRHAKYDRHGPRTNFDFTKEAGIFIDIWSRAYVASGDEQFATAIETLTRRYQKRMNERNLLDYDAVREDYCNNGHNITLAAELHDAAERVASQGDADLAQQMNDLAVAIDAGFLALQHRPDMPEAGFIATSTTATGEPRDRDGLGPGGYSVLWGMGYGRQTTSMVAMHCFRRARQLQEGETADAYRRLALAACQAYATSPAPPMSVDVWPVESGTAILMHLTAFQDTGDELQRQQARRRANEAVGIFWEKQSPLPKTSRRQEQWETITGAETLIFALMALHITEEQLKIEIPFSDIDR